MENSKIMESRTRKSIYLLELSSDQLIDLAITILMKPESSRTVNEIKTLLKCTEGVKFFQSLGHETHEQCCSYMTHKYLKAESVLFEIGTFGSTFYIILKGSVEVWVNIPKVIEEIATDGKKTQKTEMVLTNVKTLGSGDAFGELALMENRPRAATIICKENCHFAVLEKTPFNRILKSKEQKKLLTQIDFLFKYELFEGWSFGAIKKLYYHMVSKKYIRKQIVYRQNDDAEEMFFIRSGEFQVSVKIWKSTQKTNSSLAKSKSELFTFKPVILLKNGEYFGEEELINNEKRKYTVECLSQEGDLFILSKKDFLRKIMTTESSKEYILNQINIKNSWNTNQIRNISFHNLPQKAILTEEISPEDPKEFCFESTFFNNHVKENETINNHKNSNLNISRIKRYSSTNLKQSSVHSNLFDLFKEDLKSSKKTVNKTLHDLLNKSKNHGKNMELNGKNFLNNIKPNENQNNRTLTKTISLYEKSKQTVSLHKKIMENFKENKSKLVNLGNYEIAINEKRNILKSFILDQKKNDTKQSPKFIILNGKTNSIFQKDPRINDSTLKKTTKTKNFEEIFPLKYRSGKLYEEKRYPNKWKRKAFSFHSSCKASFDMNLKK